MHPIQKIMFYLLLIIITILINLLGGFLLTALFHIPLFAGILIFIVILFLFEFIMLKVDTYKYNKDGE